ncbi:MAG: hypothetical protein SPK23_03310 [Eubacteriales bacterium]|nr:hypothetical protein [Clostridiales bacterium]MDY5836138.1 hypothetical protein [Eubacteriales bacterium]
MADDQKQKNNTQTAQANPGPQAKSVPDQANLLNFAQPIKGPEADKKNSWNFKLSAGPKPGAKTGAQQTPNDQAGFPQWQAKKNNKPTMAAKAIQPPPLKQAGQALGSKRNVSHDPMVIAKPARRPRAELSGLNAGERYATRRMSGQPKNELTKALSKLKQERKSGKKKPRLEAWQQEKLKGAKVYKLTAYTTTDNINKRFRSMKRQSILRKVLVTLIIILLLASLIGKYINLSDTSELQMIVGS